jgi:hypothetical protein
MLDGRKPVVTLNGWRKPISVQPSVHGAQQTRVAASSASITSMSRSSTTSRSTGL